VRSLVALDSVFQGSGIGTVLVVHHTDCGMTQTDEKGFGGRIGERYPDVEKYMHEGCIWGAINE
jgi:carbonic anhydrase